MKQKEVEIEGKKYVVRRIGYVESKDLIGLDKKEQNLKLVQLATGLSEEELKALDILEGALLERAVNEVNDLSPLLKPVENSKQS